MTLEARSRTGQCLFCDSSTPRRSVFDEAAQRCETCGFMWTPPTDPQQSYDADYYHGGGYEDYFLSEPRSFEANQRVDWLLDVGSPQRVLEAGCAGGFFLAALQERGIRATGMDVSEESARWAREHLNVDARCADFTAQPPPGGFDAVCGFHVLEHVVDPREFLHSAHTALAPDGQLLLEVPNAESAAAERLGTAWPGLQPEYHLWHFGPDSLSRLVTESGFEVLDVTTVVFRAYMPRRYRWRRAHTLAVPDVRNIGSLRLTHPDRGDLLRITARRLQDKEIA